MSRSGEWAVADLPRGMRVGLLCAALLAPAAARAQPAGQPDSVIVNWGALDALGAAADKPGTAAIRLTAPPRRVVAVMPPPQKPAEPTAPATPAPTASAVPPPPSISPVPAPAAVPAPSPPASQQLALATVPRAVGTAAPVPNRVTMVRYAPGAADIPDDGKSVLDTAAASLAANSKLRLQLVAYASGNADDAIAARRLSLTRAVQMRAYLIAKGVPSIRMEVRALGDQNVGTGPADRVDLVIVDR